ncbi:MAG: F-box protein [Verrucomicrobia bacterium]|nr:F-box protein [Verrucomicrobiota bacterium]
MTFVDFINSVWAIAGEFPAAYGGFSSGEAEEKPGTVSISGVWVPKNVVWLILRHLSPEELPRLCAVCRVFNQVASSDSLWRSYNLKEVFTNTRFIGREEWERYVYLDPLTLVERGRPYVTKQDFKEIKQMEKQVEGKQGITIMTFFKGRTLKHAQDSADHCKGNETAFVFFPHFYQEKIWDVECPKTITVAIANGIIDGTRGRSPRDARGQIGRDLNCRFLTLREAVDFALMVYRMSPSDAMVRLFGPEDNNIFCRDVIKDYHGHPMEVYSYYGWSSVGPWASIVDGIFFDGARRVGASCVREFKVVDDQPV